MISILMPAYNAARYMPEAIESTLSQTYSKFELIIIDDGSTDETLGVAERYAALDQRVRIIRNAHGGVSHARNSGVAAARYEWIACMDADDVMNPYRLEKQLHAAVANPRVVIWGTFAYHINERGDILSLSKQGSTTEGEFYDNISKSKFIYPLPATALMRRSDILRAGGYDSKFDGCEDAELYERMSEYGPLVTLPEPLYKYRLHSNTMSMQKFYEARTFFGYIQERCKGRREGYILNYGNFLRKKKELSPVFRLGRSVQDMGRFYYRKAGVCHSLSQNMRACFFFTTSVILNPTYSLPRVWRQKFSREVRHMLRHVEFRQK